MREFDEGYGDGDLPSLAEEFDEGVDHGRKESDGIGGGLENLRDVEDEEGVNGDTFDDHHGGDNDGGDDGYDYGYDDGGDDGGFDYDDNYD
ncbi:hypothetical protein SBOR_9733 [Sclerotinia borealis F-4128]|uniref:Uncharacterized protein n=1 Tax=Sclerotinia borealis (strain F-4128) TaxID=1432307 RepID=W9C4Q8_SCLBF|nr:hypothetical protein SBOR_9733 [Sclerotinia borealis F-4128]